jgi:spore coat protein U-like protein
MKKRRFFSSALIVMLFIIQPVFTQAETVTNTMDVSANVPVYVTAVVQPLEFGDLSLSEMTAANTTITVAAPVDTLLECRLDGGLYWNGVRRIYNGGGITGYIIYKLYDDPGYGVVDEWGDDGAGTGALPSVTWTQGTGDEVLTVYGRAWNSAGKEPGAYSDVVTVDVLY